MVTSYSVANSILNKSFLENIFLSSQKLFSLVYLMYEHYLDEKGELLFLEKFIETDRGPVLSSLYYKFNIIGDNYIENFIKDAKDNMFILNGIEYNKILDFVWNKYKNFTELQLFEIVNSDYKKREVKSIKKLIKNKEFPMI